MRRVLFVSYPFPPEGGAAVKRTIKFIKYLPKMGWEPIVLTVKNGNYDAYDPSLLDQINERVRVIRAFTAESILKKNNHDKSNSGKTNGLKLGSPKKNGILHRLWVNIYHSFGIFLGIPDARILWLPHALIKGIQILLKYKCEVIYSTGPTFTDHIVGAILKLFCKKKLILDFRDAWIGDPSRKWKSSAIKRINYFLEKHVIMLADFVVSTTEGIANDFKTRYPNLKQAKFVTITNGFDSEDFNNITEHPSKNKKFRIVHTGILIRERSPRFFLEALAELIEQGDISNDDVEVIFVGRNFRFNDNKQIEDYIYEMNLTKIVQIIGFISRDESLMYQKSADLLLLIIGIVPEKNSSAYGLSGKAFDYAICGKKILALAQDGATAEFIRKTNVGCVVSPDHVESIKKSLIEAYRNKKLDKKDACRNEKELKKYDFSRLTNKLVDYMEECLNI